jgi:hypothetical protein
MLNQPNMIEYIYIESILGMNSDIKIFPSISLNKFEDFHK